MREPGFDTICAHFGEDPASYEGAAVPPIYQSSLFSTSDAETFRSGFREGPPPFLYTRVDNPTTHILEQKLAALEHTGAARCFGSGMGAISAAVMHFVSAGDHVVTVESVYPPTRTLLTDYLSRFDVGVTYVPGTDTQQFADAIQPKTRLIYLESPSSHVFLLQDLAAVVGLARERGIATVIDNSWASPYFQTPADLGVDLVVHSATKYLGGHCDIIAGAAMGSKETIASLKMREGNLLGAVLDPFASWLMLRGVRTLSLRMDRHYASARRVATMLEAHSRVAEVHYPGLESHSQHALAMRQMRGCSGLLSFELKDGGQEAADAFVNRLHYFHIGASWGGFESLALPSVFRQSHRWGARIHVGLETVDDLLEDLEQALR